MVFSKELVNTGRQSELDLLKTVVIFFMIQLHVFEVGFSYTWEDLYFCDITPIESIIFAFINGSGAFSFMVCMGITLLFSKKNDAGIWVKRGWNLLLAWIILSALINLPCSMIFHDRAEMTFSNAYFANVFSSDIFFLAGFFFLFIGIMKKLNLKLPVVTAIVIVLFVLGQFISLKDEAMPDFVSAILGNFVITDYSTFPVLNWLIVPFIGIWFGKALRHCVNKDRLYAMLGTGGLLLSTGILFFLHQKGWLVQEKFPEFADPCVFYNLYAIPFLISCGLFSILVSLCHFCVRLFKAKWFISFYEYCSRNLTVIYFVQWLIIPWFFFFYPRIEEKTACWKGVPIMLLIFGLSIAGTELYSWWKRKYTEK